MGRCGYCCACARRPASDVAATDVKPVKSERLSIRIMICVPVSGRSSGAISIDEVHIRITAETRPIGNIDKTVHNRRETAAGIEGKIAIKSFQRARARLGCQHLDRREIARAEKWRVGNAGYSSHFRLGADPPKRRKAT